MCACVFPFPLPHLSAKTRFRHIILINITRPVFYVSNQILKDMNLDKEKTKVQTESTKKRKRSFQVFETTHLESIFISATTH